MLLVQTSDLLSHAITAVDSAHGSELSKKALRILLERLCAVCCMREGANQPHMLASLAQTAKRLQQRQQQLVQQGGSSQHHQSQGPLPAGGAVGWVLLDLAARFQAWTQWGCRTSTHGARGSRPHIHLQC